ncbi:Crp/Fnr family transcriptional regulator [Sandaracinobacteroides hominis]|uniref:Crp/Fnr family transcriptional regulator n=1 Tax=Sandaracinobacteroides hominis TaxID=2780086 RepID=UPI0018F66CE5|nr:Crp/Fnr family transcriptional regulator [Sandaracinobacteroides hominis]
MLGRAHIWQGLPQLAARGRDTLAQTGWLASTPADFREAMLAATIFRTADPGVEFMHGGDAYGGLEGIAEGSAELSFLSGHPDTRAIHLAHAGFWAGYKTLLGRQKFLSLIAKTPVVWALIPQHSLERLLCENPRWWREISLLADMMNDVAGQIISDLSRQNSEIRAVAAILRLAGCRLDYLPDPLPPAELHISQNELASMAVMSRNTLNGIVGRLVDRGHVELGYRCIRIRNAAALRAMVNADE